jgi:TIR domain
VRVIKVFVASPGDVVEERKAVEPVVAEINRTLGDQLGCRLEVVMWETDAYAAASPLGAQPVIDSQIDVTSMDVVIGIFWTRFGTDTGFGLSGSAHEIQRALEPSMRRGKPHVMVYFCDRPARIASVNDAEQQKKVLELREQLGKRALTFPYEQVQQFKDLVRQHLVVFLKKSATGAPEPRPVEEIQFTVYRPNVVRPGEWKTMLAFMHLTDARPDAPADEPSPVERVQTLARQALGKQAPTYGHSRAEARSSVPRESEITLVPFADGLEFRPNRRTFLWIDDVHQEQFTVRARPEADGTIARGRLSAFLGAILLAEVDISTRVDSGASTGQSAPTKSSSASLYRRVFASYSHRDEEIVRQFERYVEALGDVYLRDIRDIRSGMDWTARLRELIAGADVFQLFWSNNAMHSPNVRHEWEYALSLNRPGFVRPTYWEDPFPESQADGLPPEALRRLHFHRLGGAAVSSQEAEIEALIARAKEAVAEGRFDVAVALSKDVLSLDPSSVSEETLIALRAVLEETRSAEEQRFREASEAERVRQAEARRLAELERRRLAEEEARRFEQERRAQELAREASEAERVRQAEARRLAELEERRVAEERERQRLAEAHAAEPSVIASREFERDAPLEVEDRWLAEEAAERRAEVLWRRDMEKTVLLPERSPASMHEPISRKAPSARWLRVAIAVSLLVLVGLALWFLLSD